MRILFVADGRSPIAINWIRHWTERGDEVFLASTFDCDPDLVLKGLEIIPVALSGTKKMQSKAATSRKSLVWGSRTLGLRAAVRQWFGPITIPLAARRLRALIEKIKPELVHAMRVPFEGMLAAEANPGLPLLISIWGNDFTLHARSTPLMGDYTRRTLRWATALHADCQRDIRLARELGFDKEKTTLVAPGNGGVDKDIFYPPDQPASEPMVVNPRGFRKYIRNDTFFKAVPLIVEQRPEARFICPGMADETQAHDWVRKFGIEKSVDLQPVLPYTKMADLYRSAQILVSPSTHDGTPNSLLEGMACGCYPVAGELESIREWIAPGVNGQLVDPSDARSLADAILMAMNHPELRKRAADYNSELITERAEYARNMARVEEFYRKVVTGYKR